MATADTLARLSPYAERLLDDYVYDELEDAGTKLRAAYKRVSGRRAKPVDDPKVIQLVRESVESAQRAVLAAAGREPDPPSRKPRILAALLIVVGIAVLVKRLSDGQGAEGQ